jgi:hypothetical protein
VRRNALQHRRHPGHRLPSDLAATHGELVEIEKPIAAAKEKHNGSLKELGLNLLP